MVMGNGLLVTGDKLSVMGLGLSPITIHHSPITLKPFAALRAIAGFSEMAHEAA